MITRTLLKTIQNRLFKGKAIIIIGPRQSGKTTLLKNIIHNSNKQSLYLNCDEVNIRKRLQNTSSNDLKNLIGKAQLILIDEAQRIQNIGITLKLLIDQIKNVQIVATGSSAFDLSNKINEPLTGRKFEYYLLPISTMEMIEHTHLIEEENQLNQRLIYGMYPDVINNPGSEREILENLTESYLYKDIFAFQDLRKPEVLERLIESLALQVASQVSYNEIARSVGIDQTTVQRYIELLEKTFVIFRLRSFSRNMRNELKKSRKIYFYDNGIRNAIISNFNPTELRNDIGSLWENFLISERLKLFTNKGKRINRYFWRTLQQQEIDYIEDSGGILNAFEFKWSSAKKARFSKSFLQAYPNHITMVVSRDNYLDFLSPKSE